MGDITVMIGDIPLFFEHDSAWGKALVRDFPRRMEARGEDPITVVARYLLSLTSLARFQSLDHAQQEETIQAVIWKGISMSTGRVDYPDVADSLDLMDVEIAYKVRSSARPDTRLTETHEITATTVAFEVNVRAFPREESEDDEDEGESVDDV